MDIKRFFYAQLRQLPWLKKTIIFVHIPKTAGISLNTVLKNQYGERRIFELDTSKKPRETYSDVIHLPLLNAFRLRSLSGHAAWGLHQWLPRPYIYITLLRHPVERILSTYSYILSSPTHHLYAEMLEKNMSLEEFLAWEKSVEEVNNMQSLLLSGLYFKRNTERHPPTWLSNAKQNLSQYALIGLTEHYTESLNQFAALFGWKNLQIAHGNVTANRIRREDVSAQTIRIIEQINQYDLELYAFAQQLFNEQRSDIRAVFSQKKTR